VGIFGFCVGGQRKVVFFLGGGGGGGGVVLGGGGVGGVRCTPEFAAEEASLKL